MHEKLTFTEDGKMYGTSGALLEVWRNREKLKAIEMKYIPLCG